MPSKIIPLLVCLITALSTKAYDMELDGLRYDYVSYNSYLSGYGDIHVVGYSSSVPEDLLIPTFVQYEKGINRRKCLVTSIDSYAFQDCTLIKKVTFSGRTIYSKAFWNCTSLQSIHLRGNYIGILSQAFHGCTSLSEIIIDDKIPPTIYDENSFDDETYNNATVIVPEGYLETYKNAEGWKRFVNITDGTKKTYALNITSVGNGSVTYKESVIRNSTKSFSVLEGDTISIYYNRDQGYRIKSVSINNGDYYYEGDSDVQTILTQTVIKNVTEDVNIFVEFEAIPPSTHSLSIKSSGNGYVYYNQTTIQNETKNFSVYDGSDATIEFHPYSGYQVKQLKINGTNVAINTNNSEYTITNITSNTIVEVEFESIPPTTYTLSVTASGYGYAYYNNTTIRNATKYFSVNEGTSATITFNPDNGYRIKSVKKDGSSISVANNQYTISNIQSNTTIVVEFEAIPPITYSLSITASGYGHASYDNTSIRNTTKTFIVNEGTSPTIIFAPDDGYRIKHVKKNGSSVSVTNNQYIVSNIQSDTNVEVEFEVIPITTYSLTVKATGNGYASFGGTTARNNTKILTVNAGSSVTISFSPDNGHRVKSVKKNGTTVTSSVSNNQYTLSNIQSDTTVEVEFEAIPVTTYDLTISATGSGYASYSGSSIRNSSRSFYANEGTSPIITITPDNGYRIKTLKKNGSTVLSNYASSYQYTVSNISANTTVEVEFEAIPVTTYSLMVKATGYGSALYNSTSVRNTTKIFTVNEGTSATIYFTPDNGYKIKSVKKNGSSVSVTNNQYSVSNIQSNTTVEVEFEAIPVTTYSLTIKATGNGYASYNGTTIRNTTKSFTVSGGTSATFTFIPDNGYRIKSVKKDGASVSFSMTNSQYTVDNIQSNTTVEVEFEAIPVTTYTLSIKASGNGSVSYSSTNIRNDSNTFFVKIGTSATIYISPDNGYRIKSVKQNGSTVTSSVSNNSYTVNNNQSNTTVEVEFEEIPVITYTLAIKSTGAGLAFYNNTSVRNNMQYFTVDVGASATISFYPDSGNRVKSVKKGGTDVTYSVSNNKYTVSNIQSNTTVEVEFEAIPVTTYTLTIAATGYGYASYNNTTARNTTKTFTVNAGTSATITFYPGDGHRIKNVKKNGSTVTSYVSNNTYTVSNIQSNTTVEVEFEAIPTTSYTLTIKASGNGYAFYDNTSARNSTQYFTVDAGSFATISFFPDNGYRIKNVKKDGTNITSSVSNNKYTVSNIQNNTTIEVEFEAIPVTTYDLTISATGSGYVSYSGSSIRNSSRSFYVNAGSSPVIAITPDNGYRIKALKKNGSTVLTNYSGSYQYTVSNVSANTTVAVEFETIPVTTYDLTISASGNGSVSYSVYTIQNNSRSFSANAGTSPNITIKPHYGYRIKTLKRDGSTILTNYSGNYQYTVSNISANTTVAVEFEANPATTYSLTINAIGNGFVTYAGYSILNSTRTFTVYEGSSITIAFIPGGNSRVKYLKVNDIVRTSDISDNKYTISSFSANTTIEVEFESIPPQTYSLTITASGYGSVTYLNNTIRDGSQSFTLQEDESATILFTPEVGCDINHVMVNGTDRTLFLDNNRYIISSITSNTTIEVEFTGGTKAFAYQGINYNVLSYSDRTILMAKGNYERFIEVPAKFTYLATEWTVVGTEDDALEESRSLAAVIWHPNAPFTASASNPNLLLYVNDAAYAQTTISNVIASGTAQEIILSDAASGNEFYCPQRFVAQNISYTHHYRMETGIDEARGWETLVLPFDVEKITHESKGSAVPFVNWRSGDAARPFWLMQLDNSGWKEAESIKANRPYIISMPNNANYMDEFLLSGAVTFSATNATIDKTENLPTASYNGRTFIPNYAEIGMGDGAYALNVSNDIETNVSGAADGSRFVLNLRKIHPFEAYMTTSTRGTRSIDISDGMGIIDNNNDEERISVYNMKGMMVKTNTGYSVEEIRRSLPAGVYIINKRKVLVK